MARSSSSLTFSTYRIGTNYPTDCLNSSSRTAFRPANKSNPWESFLPLQDAWFTRVPNLPSDMDSGNPASFHIQGSFIRLKGRPFHSNRRITRSCFRTCSTARPASQRLYAIALWWIFLVQLERTLNASVTLFGGQRPSQTTKWMNCFPWLQNHMMNCWTLNCQIPLINLGIH